MFCLWYMAKGKKDGKSNPKGTKGPEEIKHAYIEYVLGHDKKPGNVFRFCKEIGIEEKTFYKSYSSFKALEKIIWQGYATQTIESLKSDDNYSKFTVREKILAFYFTVIEALNANRSFVLYTVGKSKAPTTSPSYLKKFRKEFYHWAEEVIEEGKDTGEIAKRPFLEKRYSSLLWLHFQFILKFWSNDDSNDFEKTDEAIEKSVNLAFDVIGKGILDNAFDFAKFLYQQRKN